MTSHLLDLRALHIAAPGVLDVVFGPDGPCDFWSCPVRGRIAIGADLRTPEDWYWVAAVLAGGRVLTTDCAPHVEPDGAVILDARLDCSVSSVESRLLGLCARAMDPAATGQAWLEPGAGFWSLRYRVSVGHDVISWRFTGRLLYGSSRGIGAPDLPADLPDVASFIAALVTALAPRIAALGGDR